VEARHRFGAQSQRASDGSSTGVRQIPASTHGRGFGAPSAGRNIILLAIAATVILAVWVTIGVSASSAAPPAQFGTEGSGAGELREPRGIGVDQQSGDLYIGDRNNNRIDKFGPEGEFLLSFGWGVADGTTEALQACGPEATPSTATCFAGIAGPGAGQFNHPEGVAVDNDPSSPSFGDVYVVDAGNDRIQKSGSDGNFILTFGGEVNATTHADICLAGESCQAGVAGTAPGEFEGLAQRTVAVGSDGTVYVGDLDRVQLFSPAGVPESEVALPAAGAIENVAVDSAGDIYVAGGELTGVHKYDVAGTELGSPRATSGSPSKDAVTVGPADQLFVNELLQQDKSHHILTYSSSGSQIASFDAGPESLSAQRGIAYADGLEVLYALNPKAVRLVMPPPPGPLVINQSAGEIQPTTATLAATLNPEGSVTEYHFEYGTTAAYGENTAAALLEPVDEIQTVTLKATTGSYLLSFKNESTVEIPLKAEASEVQTDLEALSTIGAGNVSVTGPARGPYAVEFIGTLGDSDQPALEAEPGTLKEVTPVEGEERVKPGTASVATSRPGADIFTDRPVSAPITGLQPGTTYHYRVVAENSEGEAKGPDQTFTTLPPVSIEAVSATGVSATAATLGAELNPHGLPSSYHFEYGLSTAYGNDVPIPDGSLGEGTATVLRSASIAGLQPGTIYHYRVVAENSLGVVTSEDHQFTTQGTVASLLPDARVWEQVSPPNKHGSPLEPIPEESGDIQAASDGGALTYIAKGPISSEPPGVRSLANTQLLSTRGAGGWSTEVITTPYEQINTIRPGFVSEYLLFDEQLSSGIVEPQTQTPLSPQAVGETLYQRQADREYLPLLTPANVRPGAEIGEAFLFATATPDLRHVVISSEQSLIEGFETNGAPSLYELSAGILRPVSILPGGESTGEAGLPARVGGEGQLVRNAISSDGDRVFFGAGGHLYARDLGLNKTVQLDLKQGAAIGGEGTAEFQDAGAEGTRIFFKDTARLTEGSTASETKPDLYMCELSVIGGAPTCSLTDLTVDHNPGESADVRGSVIGSSADGSAVYFVAQGALTEAPNGRGEHAVAGNCGFERVAGVEVGVGHCNLYRYDAATDTTRFITVLSGEDSLDWSGQNGNNLGGLTARVSPNGRYLAFMSERSLTGYDNRDAESGVRDQEVFLYDDQAPASEALRCASCNPTGARPLGVFDPGTFPGLLVDHPKNWGHHWLAGSIPGWTRVDNLHALYQSRYLSNSGRLFFTSSDALVPQDSNGAMDVYEYEAPQVGSCTNSTPTFSPASGGCVNLISSGTSAEESAFLDASENGDDVFFLTASRLVSTDVDSAADVYDASVGGSAAAPVKPVECEGDGCQQPAVPPVDATPGSLTFNGAGNVVQCPTGKVKQKGRCVKKKQQKKSKKKHKKAGKTKGKKQKKGAGKKQKRAGSKRGGHK
jgi:hypothetical protein